MKQKPVKYTLLDRGECEVYLLSDERCKDGDFYYDKRYDRIMPWIDSVEQHGVKGLCWEGLYIFRIVSGTVNYIYGCGTVEHRSNWERMDTIKMIELCH